MASMPLPKGMDAHVYDEVFENATALVNPNSASSSQKSAWFVFVNAWNGLADRVVAANSYSDAFSASIQALKAHRYDQDHALFGFSASALSSIECLCMGCYGVGAMISPKHFSMKNAESLIQSPLSVSKCYSKLDPTLRLSRELELISKSIEFQELSDLRNALSHRGTLARSDQPKPGPSPHTIPSNPKDLPEHFRYSCELIPDLTAIRMTWVIQSVNTLAKALLEFIPKRT
jgi:hypothetical protein